MKIDKHGKSRFQFLCARIPELGYDNNLGMIFVPVKIRAIQGHSAEALKSAGGLYANSTLIYCADNVSPERKAAFAGVPICSMTEVPEVAYHRTMRSNWKSIAKSGLALSLEVVTLSTAAVHMSTCRSIATVQMGIDPEFGANAPSRY